MAQRSGPPFRTWIASAIGIALVTSLAGLSTMRWVLPLFAQGVFDYGAAANDPMVWSQLYVGLLVLGLIPSTIAFVFAIEGTVAGHGGEAWLALGLNGAFLLTAARLGWILGRQGFFGFLLASMQAFIEV